MRNHEILPASLPRFGSGPDCLPADRLRKQAQAGSTWQDQYDLGMLYLSEGNYEEAIIAFTAAIEIDPKRPEAYEKAAEAYEALGDMDSAWAVLEQGVQATG